jgi:hypothetical protein
MLLGTPLCVRNIPLFERLGKLTDNIRELSKKKKKKDFKKIDWDKENHFGTILFSINAFFSSERREEENNF